jgi:hypothetical protein
LRQPNTKWTVLQITWLSVARVRKAIVLKLGYDPVIEDFDQSPFHMNEVGSENAGSLPFRGVQTLALKEGHAATRERWTANATVTSSAHRARLIPNLCGSFFASRATVS